MDLHSQETCGIQDGLRKLNLLLLKNKRLWQDPTDFFKYLKGYCREDGTRLFSEEQKAKVQQLQTKPMRNYLNMRKTKKKKNSDVVKD